MVGAGGLMAIAQLAPIANDFKIAGRPGVTGWANASGTHLRA